MLILSRFFLLCALTLICQHDATKSPVSNPKKQLKGNAAKAKPLASTIKATEITPETSTSNDVEDSKYGKPDITNKHPPEVVTLESFNGIPMLFPDDFHYHPFLMNTGLM